MEDLKMEYKEIKIDRHIIEIDLKNNDILKIWWNYKNNKKTTSFNYCYSSNCFYNFETESKNILTRRQKNILKNKCNKFLQEIFLQRILKYNDFVLSDEQLKQIEDIQEQNKILNKNILEAV